MGTAISNAGAREDSTRIGSGGVVRRQAVDVSPLRRVNQAIYLICKGSRESAFRSLKSISETLSEEIINASKGSQGNSFAVRKKDELAFDESSWILFQLKEEEEPIALAQASFFT